MRTSIAAIAGAAAVAQGAAIPSLSDMVGNVVDGVMTLPHTLFEGVHKFHTISLEDAMAKAANQPDTEPDTKADEVSAMAKCTRNPSVRVEWRNMAQADRTAYLNAVQCVMNQEPARNADGTIRYPGSTNRYEDVVQVHQTMTNQIHQVEIFLPWHRYFLHAYMRLLRQEPCGYTGPLPWWDETLDAGNFGASPLFQADAFGSLPPPTANGDGVCITDGAFANITLHIGPGETNTDHCLARALDDEDSSQCNQDFINACNSMTSYVEMENCNEAGPHAYGHLAVGAVMEEVSASPGDPTFFLHHAFVDRMWKKWQNADASRLTSIAGCAAPATDGGSCPPLTMQTVMTTNGIDEDLPVEQIMDTQNEYLCYVYDY